DRGGPRRAGWARGPLSGAVPLAWRRALERSAPLGRAVALAAADNDPEEDRGRRNEGRGGAGDRQLLLRGPPLPRGGRRAGRVVPGGAALRPAARGRPGAVRPAPARPATGAAEALCRLPRHPRRRGGVPVRGSAGPGV